MKRAGDGRRAGPYRSRRGVILGVCRGIAEHADVSLFWVRLPLEPVEANYYGEVVERYRYRDGSGEIGVITSVTQPFCGNCTRARLSPDGRLVTCLFASTGFDLKTPLRAGATDEEIEELLERVWRARTDRYSEERTAPTGPRAKKIEMYQIGG